MKGRSCKGPTAMAFTLMEMLVVLAVMAILLALLFPAYQKVGESAKVSKDVSNLRQIGCAIVLYANDAGYIPGEQWPSSLGTAYLPDLRICQSPFDHRTTTPDGTTPVSYDVNSNLWGAPMLAIVSPVECILVAPLTADTPPRVAFLSTSKEPGLAVPLSMESNGRADYGGTCDSGKRIPVLFSDGHASVISISTFHSALPNPIASSAVQDLRWNR
jgi:prepilin-type N-terminal cleavage/methylation domain-containing protein